MEIIGVMPESIDVFAGDTGIWRPFSETDFPTDGTRQLNQRYLQMIGRLHDGFRRRRRGPRSMRRRRRSVPTWLESSDWKIVARFARSYGWQHRRPCGSPDARRADSFDRRGQCGDPGRWSTDRAPPRAGRDAGHRREPPRIWRGLLAELLVIAASRRPWASAWPGSASACCVNSPAAGFPASMASRWIGASLRLPWCSDWPCRW